MNYPLRECHLLLAILIVISSCILDAWGLGTVEGCGGAVDCLEMPKGCGGQNTLCTATAKWSSDPDGAIVSIELTGLDDGAKEIGWIAIGFTETPSMDDASVIDCVRHPNSGHVRVTNSYNTAVHTNVAVDDFNGGIIDHTSKYWDGVFTCEIKRMANYSGEDARVFNTFNKYVLLAHGESRYYNGVIKSQHTKTPAISSQRVNLGTPPPTEEGDKATTAVPHSSSGSSIRSYGQVLVIALAVGCLAKK